MMHAIRKPGLGGRRELGATLVEYAIVAVLLILGLVAVTPIVFDAVRSSYSSDKNRYDLKDANYLITPTPTPPSTVPSP